MLRIWPVPALLVALVPIAGGAVPESRLAARQRPADAATAAALRSVARYLADYEQAIVAVVAEEDYHQEFQPPFRPGAAAVLAYLQSRTLKSDLLILTDPTYGLLTFRDVFEVDGRPVRDRDERLARLSADPNPDARAEAKAITDDAARFNLNVPGVSVNRTLNVPMAALLYLRGPFQSHSAFTTDRVETTGGRRASVLSFVEQGEPRLIRSANNAVVRGTAWVEETSGRVLRTALTYTLSGGDKSTAVRIEVVYGEEPKSQLWVPVSMDERYAAVQAGQPAGILTARATYSKFRQFKVDVSDQPATVGGGPDKR